MNTIKAQKAVLEPYVIDEELFIYLDGVRFDEWIAQKTGCPAYKGLLPVWAGHLENQADKTYIWSQLKKAETRPVNVPMLICGEFQDFTDMVISCEIIVEGRFVKWLRIGSDVTPFPDYVGEDISWFCDLEPLVFEREQYEACFKEFADRYWPYYD